MSYVIIIFIIALALAPIFSMMPSKRQRHQAEMRQRAMSAGLQVKVCDLPQTHRLAVRKEDVVHGVVYRLLWRPESRKNINFQFIVVRGEVEPETIPEGISSALHTLLGQLPDDIVAVEYANVGVAIYWLEGDDLEMIDLIKLRLEALKETLSNEPLPALLDKTLN